MDMKKLKSYFLNLFDKDKRFLTLAKLNGFYPDMSDEEYLKRKWKAVMGKELDLDNPQTFNEKLQWLKLYDRKPEYTTMVDKYAVKKYVADKIGEQYIIPTLGVWEHFDDINFDKLPDQFVLKCTHDSGGLVICRDKSKFDKKAARTKINRSLGKNYYYSGREWPYKNVPPRIIAEKYMKDSETNSSLNDYKFLCFEGQPRIIEVHGNRFTDKYYQDFYNINWTKSHITQGSVSNTILPKPLNFNKMIEFSKVLSKGVYHLRVDWYEINGRLYFGELTFYDGSGFQLFDKNEYDMLLGGLIKLPENKVNINHK